MLKDVILFLSAAGMGYLAGSVPFAYVIGKVVAGSDIRKCGSGNVGATNLARVAGAKWGVICFLLDTLKGAVPALIFRALGGEGCALWAGASAVFGHMFTIWLRGSGGKGVATAAGVFLALAPLSMAYAFLVFLVVGPIATRTISAGAITAAVILPVLTFSNDSKIVAVTATILSVIVIYRHAGNIERLYNGTESRLWKGLP